MVCCCVQPLGFLKVEVAVKLLRPMAYTLMRHPFCHMPNLAIDESVSEGLVVVLWADVVAAIDY